MLRSALHAAALTALLHSAPALSGPLSRRTALGAGLSAAMVKPALATEDQFSLGDTPQELAPPADEHGVASLRGLDEKTLFGNGARPSDVVQGDANTCFELANLDALTRRNPKFAHWLFARDAAGRLRRDGHGQPLVRVFERNPTTGLLTPRLIPVPREVPADADGDPILAQWVDGKKWVSAVEAAAIQDALKRAGDRDWMKHFQRVEAGWPVRALEWFTGQRAEAIVTDPTLPSAFSTFENIQARLRAGKVLVTNSLSPNDIAWRVAMAREHRLLGWLPSHLTALPDELARLGVLTNHAHAVTGTDTHGGRRFVHLRSPYGVAKGNDTGDISLDFRHYAFLFPTLQSGDLPPELRTTR